MKLYFIVILFFPFAALSESLPSSFLHAMTNQQLVASGKEQFLNRCSGCHGVDAKGNGPAAPMLHPKPRNLVEGEFKFRSTSAGSLPTTADLMRTLNQGIPGSSMPPFHDLPEIQKVALVTYIKSLRPDWSEATAEQQMMMIPSPPGDIFRSKKGLMAAASRGRVLFAEGCQSCHGEGGLGDGPSATGLVDSLEVPIRPANLTSRTIKSGATARDIFKVLMTGVSGTPMPSYYDVYTAAQTWDMVAFIFYLRGRALGIYSESDVLAKQSSTVKESQHGQ